MLGAFRVLGRYLAARVERCCGPGAYFRIMKFEELPGRARLWVHVADRGLTAEEQEALAAHLAAFLSEWSAHGAALAAAGRMLYDRVLVVGLDEEQAGATGCSIDKLVSFLRAHGASNRIDWFDRHQVLWRQPGENAWNATRTPEFWALRKAEVVHAGSEVVDPLAACLEDAGAAGQMLVKRFDESWHADMWN